MPEYISDVFENKIKHLINQRVRKYNTVNQNFVAFFVKIEPKATSNKAKPISENIHTQHFCISRAKRRFRESLIRENKHYNSLIITVYNIL